MFKFFILAALIAFAAADGDDVHAETTLLKSDVRHDGFDASFETSNHINKVSSGENHGNIHGEFEWVDPHGNKVEVKYDANEHSYPPIGHPISEAILKAIEYIRAHLPKEDIHD